MTDYCGYPFDRVLVVDDVSEFDIGKQVEADGGPFIVVSRDWTNGKVFLAKVRDPEEAKT
jgi:hypothetical protein